MNMYDAYTVVPNEDGTTAELKLDNRVAKSERKHELYCLGV